jgi:secreted PhoX family phosphatase
MILLLALGACSGDAENPPTAAATPAAPPPAPASSGKAVKAPPHRLVVQGVPVPEGEGRRALRAATSATLDGVPFQPGFQVLARTGDRIGEGVFGDRTSRSGRPIDTCEGLDYTGLWQAGNFAGMVTHFECHPGAIYLTSLQADAAGRLSTVATKPVDLGPVEGGYYYCAGAPAPWGSHLAAQEYEADVRKLLPDGTVSDNYEDYNTMSLWWDGDLRPSHPWDYGWIVEVPLGGAPARRWSMGRFSHELALPMPDERTVYLSDDLGKGGALFLFQADQPRDMTAGTLYAARWEPTGDAYRLEWLSLGHLSEGEVEEFVKRRGTFEELFDVAEPVGDTCPEGLTLVRTNWGAECLRARPSREGLAGRLESRRAAALAGATVELTKAEGLAYAPELESVFLAMSRVSGPALAGEPGPDHLRLPPNRCGLIWQLSFGQAPNGPSGPYVATRASVALAGVEAGEHCAADGIANPDNLEWIAGAGTLAIAEDTPHHTNNVLWLYDVEAAALTRALTAPVDAEVSGLRWTPDFGGHGYLSVSIQGPFRGDESAPPEDRRSIAGVFGPFPVFNRP